MFDLLLENVNKHIRLDDDERTYFLSLVRHRVLKRHEFFLKAGQVCNEMFFVLDGGTKAYSVDEDGDEHILSFALSGWWMADLYSFISRKPGVLNIEAVTDTSIAVLSFDNLQLLYLKVSKFERLFRILVENSLVASQQRLIDNLSATAEERYLHFIEKYPLIPACVPQHNIASYLGITPEFLSKIRRRLAKGK